MPRPPQSRIPSLSEVNRHGASPASGAGPGEHAHRLRHPTLGQPAGPPYRPGGRNGRRPRNRRSLYRRGAERRGRHGNGRHGAGRPVRPDLRGRGVDGHRGTSPAERYRNGDHGRRGQANWSSWPRPEPRLRSAPSAEPVASSWTAPTTQEWPGVRSSPIPGGRRPATDTPSTSPPGCRIFG